MDVGYDGLKATTATVKLWGRKVGWVAATEERPVATFEYSPDFQTSGIEVAPLTMPLASTIYSFPELSRKAFHGLPGLIADSLPDRFGTAVIEAWLAAQGRTLGELDAVQRLLIIGKRGMGALEFEPDRGSHRNEASLVHIDELVDLASRILRHREDLQGRFVDDDSQALREILRVGTSAGGARAKAIIAWNPDTNEVRSGQIAADSGFEHWILKLDGVSGNRDRDNDDPPGAGAIEFAYSLMAREAGITMTPCRLFEENGRRHFMTRRFDRPDARRKLHMQSFSAMAHIDRDDWGASTYEQILLTMKRLGLGMDAIEEQFRRMVFNVIARNHDDHAKNFAFLMDRRGDWSLSPAFDLTYSYDPTGRWTAQHQTSLRGKRLGFTFEDLRAFAKAASMKRGRAEEIVAAVHSAVLQWKEIANEVGVPRAEIQKIRNAHRLDLLP